MSSANTSSQQWVGRSQQDQDTITLAPMRAMAALLDRDPAVFDADSVLPPLWHWLYFLAPASHSLLGQDGHRRTGDFLPPTENRRRMWAGSRLEFHRQIKVGESLQRVSTLKSVESRQGRSGPLLFVCVEHQISGAAGPAITEQHDIVYREASGNVSNSASERPEDNPVREAQFSQSFCADPVVLFRYSALTFNSHRIHYDRDYATGVEGYPGLVVHGPLLATLLLELARDNHPGQAVEAFEFRARRPVFDGDRIVLCGARQDATHCELWIRNSSNALCMQGSARFSDKGSGN